MAELFATGRIVDLILALMMLEAVALYAWRRLAGRGPTVLDLLPNFLAGGLLLFALRGALTGAGWRWIAACLAAALAAHSADLYRRWRPQAAAGDGSRGRPGAVFEESVGKYGSHRARMRLTRDP
ncbi:MAG: hypothetical protein N2544_02800 [Burkholderiales bacterium]|nr:hypothetical protein [Burkholderiales bacterium]